MKRAKIGPDGKKANKPKHGGRKVFFHRLWCRIQRIKIEEEQEVTDDGETTKKKRKFEARKNNASKKGDASSSGMSFDSKGDSEDCSESSLQSNNSKDVNDSTTRTESDNSASVTSTEDSIYPNPPQDNVRLKATISLVKSDDPHWLSDSCCYARKHLLEAFNAKRRDQALNGPCIPGSVTVHLSRSSPRMSRTNEGALCLVICYTRQPPLPQLFRTHLCC